MESKRALFKNKIRNIGLENYLYDNEVQLDLVETSKKEYSKSHEDYELFYDEANDKNNVLVPVCDIKGIQRVVDFTWFNILEYGSLGLPIGINHNDFNMNTAKFVDLLMVLEELNFKEKEQFFKNTDNIDFYCFDRYGEKEYYLSNDGNHRTTIAKVFGIKGIRGRKVKYFKFNHSKFVAYEKYKKNEQEFIDYINQSEFSLSRAYYGEDIYRIALEFYDNKDNYHYYPLTDCPFIFSELKADYKSVNDMILDMENIYERMESIKRQAKFYYLFYRMLPKKVLSFRKIFFPSDITDKDFAKIIGLFQAERN